MPAPSRKIVLLVSSDPRFFDLPENLFQSRGCDVFTALSGPEAATFVEEHAVALVICRGVPAESSVAALHASLPESTKLLLVPATGEDTAAYRKLPRTHVIEGNPEPRALLRTSSRLLEVPDRKYISILVQVRVSKPKPTTVFGKSRDISDGGIAVETSQQLPLYEPVVVSFLLAGADRMVQTDALVVRETLRADGKRQYGLRFLSLADEDRAIIVDFVVGKKEG